MLQAQNGRQFNLAAKVVRAFFSEKNFELKHSEALTLVSRLTGHANYEAAKASLGGPVKGVASEVPTWRQLAHAICTLDDEQLDMPVRVTEGCDENGNATFTRALQFLLAGTSSLAAGTGIFKDNQPLLLVEEFDAAVESDEAERVIQQFEVATGESGAIARKQIKEQGIYAAILRLNRVYAVNISVEDYVAYSEKNKGFWNVDFGFVNNKACATGYFSREEVYPFKGAEDLESVIYSVAVDVDLDAESELATKVRGAPVSIYQWPNRFQAMWVQLSSQMRQTFRETSAILEAKGYGTKVSERDQFQGPDGQVQGKQLVLSLYSSHGYRGGDLVFGLVDGEKYDTLRAAALGLCFESHSGRTTPLNVQSTGEFPFATDASFFIEDISGLTPQTLAKAMEVNSDVRPDTGPIVKA